MKKGEQKRMRGESIVRKELKEGLNQTFVDKDGKERTLQSVVGSKDFWETGGKIKRLILTHDFVKKLADNAGISKDVQYTILTQPDAYNNYQYTISARIYRTKDHDDCATEIGEANRSNLGSKGRGNPANMAQKRAFDRAVFRLLGIVGLLSEEELTDQETKTEMEELTHDEKKQIAPLMNQLLLATKKEHMIIFNNNMKKEKDKYTPNSLEYLRRLYRKKLADLQKTSF